MLIRILLSLVFILIYPTAKAQIAGDFMVGSYADVIKTDNSGFVHKAQLGAELNYFIDRKFTATAGIDIWTTKKVSLVIGGRWYPTAIFFVRARGLVGENDFSLGAGWNKPINENWRFEAISDFYFKNDFAIRVGFAYTIRKK